MTWSLIAREPATNNFSIAVATRFFAVGARVPYIAAGIGAIATQAMVNQFYGTEGLLLLENEIVPDEVIHMLTEQDDGRDHRQVHMMDRHGVTGAYTGSACVDWCGHLKGDGFSLAGNMLAGPRVLDDTAASYRDNAALPFPRRLIAALRAGEAAGGDKRGKQSAALVIYGEEEWPDLDLRVDDHPDPLVELARLEEVSRERFVHFRQFMPNRANPAGVTDRTIIEAEIAKALAAESKA